jgi:cadmium resistance protein CadD (predicted permease)
VKALLALRDPRAVATVVVYVLVGKLAFAPEAVTLFGLLGGLLVHLGLAALKHRSAMAEHAQAQKELRTQVDELGVTVKSLSNAVGSGNWGAR